MADEVSNDVLRAELRAVADRQGEMSRTLGKMADTLSAVVRMEERLTEGREALARAFTELDDHELRLKRVELDLPALKEARKWITGGIVAVVGAMIVAYFAGTLQLHVNQRGVETTTTETQHTEVLHK